MNYTPKIVNNDEVEIYDADEVHTMAFNTEHDNLKLALQTLYGFTPTFNVWALAGKYNVKKRQLILESLRNERVPQSKCGINNLTAELYEALSVEGNTPRNKEIDFVNKCNNFH